MGAIAVVVLAITAGLLAMAPLGAAGVAAGVRAGLVTAVAGGACYALLGRSALPAAATSSATALLLAAMLLHLLVDPALADAQVLPVLLALVGITVALSGALQVLAALAGLARLVAHVPQPVVSGLMNGVALQVVLAAWPLLSGKALGAAAPAAPIQIAAVALGLAAALACVLLTRRWPRLPATMLVLALGTLAHLLLTRQWPALGLGDRLGTLPTLLALPDVAAAAIGSALRAHAGLVVLTAVLIAGVGALESMLNALAVDRQRLTRHDPRRELIAIGMSNLLVGALGGLPVTMSRARAMATAMAGGRRREALLAGSLVLGLLVLAGDRLLALLPLPVLGGLLLALAWALIDPWSLRLLRPAGAAPTSRSSLTLVLVVMLTTLAAGLVAGVALGALLSALLFVVRMSRSLVRTHYTAAERPSRRMRTHPVEARLRPLRERVHVLELEGALFFGSGQSLLDEAERLGSGCRALLLDAENVNTIDETGIQVLHDLRIRLDERGIALRIAGLRQAITAGRAGHLLADLLASDADRAIEWAEDLLLVEDGSDSAVAAGLALHETPLLQSMAPQDRAVLGRALVPLQLAAGERLFAQGDPGDRLYLLLSGSVSVLTAPDAEGRNRRFLSLSPGTMLGETALLHGGGRSAGAVADVDSTLVSLDQPTLATLREQHPSAAASLYHAIAVHLSQRLRNAAPAASWGPRSR